MTDDENQAADVAEPSIRRCDYCRLPIPGDALSLDMNGETYSFCCNACRDRLTESDTVFTQFHGHRRLETGVSALDVSLPEGIPRNSFVLLTGLAGTRTEAMQAELVWRALQRGEPVVFVSFLEPPVSVVQEFVSLSWNVLPSLESGQLRILDCFTYRVEDRDRMYERMNDWNTHLWNVTKGATVNVRDPTNTGQLQNRLDRALEDLGAQDQGIVIIDSLTELGSLLQPVQAYDLLKDIRADICKGRFVPLFAGATITGEEMEFPHDLGYMVDGIVEMQLNEGIVEDALVKRLRVRKMTGVLTYPEWRVYEFAEGSGLVTFDPQEEMKNDEAADEATSGQGESDSSAIESAADETARAGASQPADSTDDSSGPSGRFDEPGSPGDSV